MFTSKMNKRMMILMGLVLVSAGLLLTSFRMLGGKPAPTKATEEAKPDDNLQTDSQQAAAVAVSSEEDFWKDTPALLEKARSARAPVFYHVPRRDPMRLALTNSEISPVPPFRLIIKTPSASLTGVLLGNGKAAAIINEKIYRVGDLVDGRKIVAIERNRVILRRGPDEEILKLTNGIRTE